MDESGERPTPENTEGKLSEVINHDLTQAFGQITEPLVRMGLLGLTDGRLHTTQKFRQTPSSELPFPQASFPDFYFGISGNVLSYDGGDNGLNLSWTEPGNPESEERRTFITILPAEQSHSGEAYYHKAVFGPKRSPDRGGAILEEATFKDDTLTLHQGFTRTPSETWTHELGAELKQTTSYVQQEAAKVPSAPTRTSIFRRIFRR
ncbi:MAG: hypothetical protein AAB532_02290 [Patescibacteria group bacterium]